ncbi:DNA-directed RNA polymerase subunit beta [Mycoplasma sp. ES3157-GEN-MYC]|uniref:DNA-directed RNA polymerase subunit beta n=1 Tax=Mycoplasma miroungigenitalium TaxID=754515 RepID=A0A6M4JCK6_9MOLU|nr:DNA-directed RNA polymerase subunit beta [Mycoplasma miroungigenitalium]MBU4690678.1 DNA-directed RNA polymerase subunit beta [Mycoplasma miroungigenitalium]MBU4691947.1 DNA-directed RNA polymerase subunit beta [Mycoplasma miroungigenitalium]QJR43799.1 DNA-directed RNA polymerase subunit beta [Mycoplasma miroungigenitalium]
MEEKVTKKYVNKYPYKVTEFGAGTKRRDYSVTKHIYEVQDFLKTSKESFEWFKKSGIEEAIREHYPISSSNKGVTLEYIHNSATLEIPAKEYDEVTKAKVKGTNYAGKLYGKFKAITTSDGLVKEDTVFLGEIPLMTSGGSFIINGSEKVIVSQLIRSPGAYFGRGVRNKQSDDLFNKVEILPRVGSWVEISHKVTSKNPDSVKIKIDKNKNVNIITFLGALGLTHEDIYDLFGKSDVLEESIKKDKKLTTDLSHEEVIKNCQDDLFRTIRKGDRVSDESISNLIPGLLFHKKHYNLSQTGRYMLNIKLNLVDRISGTILAQPLTIQNKDGEEINLEIGETITHKLAVLIQWNFNNGKLPSEKLKCIKPEVVYAKLLNDPANSSLKRRDKIISIKVYPSKKWMEKGKEPVRVIGTDPKAVETHLVVSDLIATINYYFNLLDGIGQDDDPDALTNKRIVSLGELVQNNLKVGLSKLEKTTRERMGAKEPDKVSPKNVTNNKLISNQMKTFFNSSKLSQFMDQINPLAEISNERRITSLGPGGLNRDTAQFEVRDVHATHYGRICPIETPEGPNIGLILNFATYAKVNEFGFLETPYFRVDNGIVDYSEPVYLTAADEMGYKIAQSTVKVDENNRIIDPQLTIRHNYTYQIGTADEIDFIEVAPNQMVSVAAGCIPFLENDDANRALMGANMQRQAVPLLETEAPFVATGIEAEIAKYSSGNFVARNDGIVEFVDGKKIKIRNDKKGIDTYNLKNFQRSNQDTVVHQKPLVREGQEVKKGDLLVDGSSFKDGELALGKNVLVAFTTYNGYNYEDAVILNERLVKDDVFTSIHIEEQTVQFRTSKAGDDELTADIPNVSKFSTRHLDEHGVVRVGSDVAPGDVLVGRVSPKGDDNPTQEEKLLLAVLQQRQQAVKDTSLKVKNGHGGTVIGVEILSRENKDQLEDGIDKIVKVSIAVKRKIKVGDKMSGRHGNKGVVSIVLPEEDMPHLEDGTPVDVMLNPQGVPSRMNIGQVLEIHLGMAARSLKTKFVTRVFDGIKKEEIYDVIEEAGLPATGKQTLINPITGEKFDNPVSVGVMYMLKLNHMVDDKMHARSVGPYSLITQQPLGGKSQNGGQRFGEMETWAIESYGATNILQEILTYKSDDINGRNQLYAALASGRELPKPGVPESFNVLKYELRGLGMKLDIDHVEVDDEDLSIQHFDSNIGGFNE